jgi:cell division protease FtsH
VNNIAKNIAIWIAIALVLMTVFQQFSNPNKASTQLVYSQFMENVKAGKVAKVQIDGRVIRGTTLDNKTFSTYAPNDLWMVSDLLKYNVEVEAKAE